MSNLYKYSNALDARYELIEQDILEAPRAELHDIAQDIGVDLSKAGADVDYAFRRALQRSKLKRLQDARVQRDHELRTLNEIAALPQSSKEQLLDAVLARLSSIQQNAPSRFTLQNRNLEEHSEEYLRTLLKQLIALDSGNNR